MVETITRKNGGLVVCDADEPGDFVSKTLGYDDNQWLIMVNNGDQWMISDDNVVTEGMYIGIIRTGKLYKKTIEHHHF